MGMTKYGILSDRPSYEKGAVFSIYMTDDEGHTSEIQSGIKSREAAEKAKERWTKREAAARSKATA